MYVHIWICIYVCIYINIHVGVSSPFLRKKRDSITSAQLMAADEAAAGRSEFDVMERSGIFDVCMYIHVYIYIYMYIYIYVYIYIHI